MTYQAVRRPSVSYGRTNTYRASAPYGERSRVMNGNPPRAAKNISAAERAELQRRREEAYRRAKRAEAEAARAAEMRRRRYEMDLARAKAYEAKMKREQVAARKAEKAKRKEAARLEEEAFRRAEIRVERRKMPWQFILGVAISFVLLMGMVFSFAQISESNAVLADIDAQIRETETQSDKLRLQLEEKNDLGVIEQIAVEEYNMVKEGSVQKKYISVSEGDRVVLETEETAEGNGFVSGMLSSAATVFDDLLDYIK